MQTIDFYGLERSAQERFRGSVNGRGLPLPILSAPASPTEPKLLIGASVACGLAAVCVLSIGYGNPASGMAILGPIALVMVVLFLGLATFGGLRAASILREHKASPFRRGLYVFPIGLIDARTAVLKLYPIEEFGGVFGPDVRGLTVDFGGKTFSFPVTDPERITAAKEELGNAKSAVADAGASRESVRPKALAALDPLQGYANPLASSEKMTREKLPWVTFAWAIALGVGLVFGLALWGLRNMKSDDSMFAQATQAGGADDLRAYLAKGKRHEPEVTSVLLPRVLLKEAISAGTVSAIEQYIATENPKGAILVEAKTALRTALLAELALAAKEGTLAALDEFAKKYPDAGLAAELAVARHGVYQAAIARYVAAAPEKAPVATAFVQRLVDLSEKNGPKVEIRFHTQRSKSMEKADRAAGQSRQFRGVVSLPSHYFDDAAEKADRDALASAFAQHFKDVFTPDILDITLGAPLDGPDTPLPAQVTVPTLFIDRSSIWAGSIQASQKPRGVFVGLKLGFNAVFRVPVDPKPLDVKLETWQVPALGALKDDPKPEETAYAAMRAKAYEQFEKKLVGTFFATK
jgi:hypothetical protein